MTSVIVIVVMLLAFGIFEVIRINIEVAAIRDKYEDAIIHVSVSNYAKLYQNVREGQQQAILTQAAMCGVNHIPRLKRKSCSI